MSGASSFAADAPSGQYGADVHELAVDWLAVPAGIYFVWVVQALYRGTFRDWNSTGRAVPTTRPKAADAPAQA